MLQCLWSSQPRCNFYLWFSLYYLSFFRNNNLVVKNKIEKKELLAYQIRMKWLCPWCNNYHNLMGPGGFFEHRAPTLTLSASTAGRMINSVVGSLGCLLGSVSPCHLTDRLNNCSTPSTHPCQYVRGLLAFIMT